MVDRSSLCKAARSTSGNRPSLAKVFDDQRRFPRIALPDVMAVQERLQQDAGNEVSVRVRPRNMKLVNGGYVMLFDKLSSILCGQTGAGARLRPNVLLGFAQKIPMAREVPVRTESGNYELTEDGKIIYILTHVGCRANVTHAMLADILNVSRPHVTEQVELMRDLEIITDWGRGWTEFDCDCLWRGSMDLRAAYSAVQRFRSNASQSDEDA